MNRQASNRKSARKLSQVSLVLPSWLQFLHFAQKLTLKQFAVTILVLFILYAAIVVGVFAWDSRNISESCFGTNTTTNLEDGQIRVEQREPRFSFSYTSSDKLSWHKAITRREFKDSESEACSIITFNPPAWTFNHGLFLPIIDKFYFPILSTFAPEEPNTWASFKVNVSDKELTSLDELESKIAKQQEFNQLLKERGRDADSVFEINYSRTQVNGNEALKSEVESDNNNSFWYFENYAILHDGKMYDITWFVSSKTDKGRAEFVDQHRKELDDIVNSISFK